MVLISIFIIKTENGDSIVDEPKITAHLKIYNDKGELNYSDINEYDGYIGIEIRGNSTAYFSKKAYSFETRDSSGEDQCIP